MERLKKINDLRRTLEEMRKINASLKERFIELEKILEAEIFTKPEMFDNFVEGFVRWSRITSKFRRLCQDFLEVPLPDSFAELEKILDAEEKKVIAASVFGRAEKFLHLFSENPDIQKLLAGYQKKLKTLLDKKSRDSKARSAVEPYAKFIDATAEKDFGKKFAIGKDLSGIFGDDFIGRALFGNELSFKNVQEDTPAEVYSELPSKKSDFEIILHEKNAFLVEDDFVSLEKGYRIENNCQKEITAKKLRKDVKERWFSSEVKHILVYAAFDSCFSIAMVQDFAKYSSMSDLENAAEILLNKGYIQRYSLDKLGSFYTSTKEFFSFIKKDNSKEFFKTFPPKVKNFKRKFVSHADFMDESVKFVLTRATFLHLHDIELAHKRTFNGIVLLSQSFQAEFVGRNGTDLVIGCFWENAEECSHFLDKLKMFLEAIDCDRLIVAGLNAQHANNIFDAINAALPEGFDDYLVFYFYSIEDENFYEKNSTETISPEEIWSKIPTIEYPIEEKDSGEEVSFDESPLDEMQIFREMIFAKKFYCATAYFRALSLQDVTYTPLYRQMACAINDPLLSISYDSEKIISLFNESEMPDENFLTAATLRTFFYNHKQFDYYMKNLHGIVKNFDLVTENSPLADLIFTLMKFKDKAKNGADYYADYRAKNRAQIENKIAMLRQEAQICLDRIKNPKERANNPRFIETKKILFNGSELADYLEYTAENSFDEGILKQMRSYLQSIFIREEAALSIENIDNFKLDKIIDEAWEEAGNKIRRKKNMSLVGELRNNVITFLKKAVEILCERVKCFEESAPLQSEEGAVEYKKIRADLIDKAHKAQKILADGKIAGGFVLIETLQEIADKLEGNYEPNQQKYFYVDFLRGDKVLLDKNYLPNFNFNTLDGTSNSIAERIIAHSRAELPSFEERIKNIFEDKGRDFGTAQLIDAYLEESKGKSFIEQNKYKLQDSIDAVKRNALKDKKKFFGFLELAQSYGQFDAAPENTKEKILKLIDHCFEFAQKSDNLGIFFRIKEYWENKIKEDAAKYAELVERKLEQGIKNYCSKTNESEDSPALQKNVEQIKKMIERRNYTVAQGLINRLGEGKLYAESEQSEHTPLQRFLEDYETYYKRVGKSGDSFKKLVGKSQSFSKAATSKGIKGGEILIDNWLPNGFPQNGDVGEDKLEKLLGALGFRVESVKRTSVLNKDAVNYKVKLLPPHNGQSSNYSHPISAFGSNAEIHGFRVTCLFGTYNADGLLARFKEIGNAENTLVLLDYALELPTRRSLARKIKAESGITKVFAVIDRVLMIYLIKNYDVMQINKILMSLIMPFAACQPYVFNPNVPIPPEIFIGREKEMRRVLDFDDVNIVYGGRQLGKTALLKMACASLDKNENNDRAVFVSLDKCDCAAAARKISQSLVAKEFFEETFSETDDWTHLAAAIKKRLASDTPNKIPHFMLALDEADEFIKNCRENDFKPVLELIDIQQQRHNGSRFKFVMAGLRDIVRFYREDSLGNNNQISKLPTLAIKPFDLEDASKLLKEPLRCLGLYFSDDENADSLAMMILETTNYFPGLIQLYCAKLIEALSKSDYASYKETDSPIYEIKEGHIQSVLSEESFNEEIKNKINMTLRLGDDKFYYVIAHLIAWRYLNDDNIEGYSAKDILNTAEEFGLENLLPKSLEQIEALLKELCELNILREADKGKYLFVRQRFLNMMGTSQEIEAEIATDFSEI